MQSVLSERIIERIDAGELRPRTHRVCRVLAGHLSKPSAVSVEVIRAFDEGSSVGNENLSTRLWSEIESLPVGQQGGRRIVVSLLRPDEGVDFHLADYLVGWAEEEGFAASEIVEAFQSS